MGERRTMTLGDGAVVATGFYEFTRIVDGKPAPLAARFTLVVAKHGGDWLGASQQAAGR